MLLSKSTFSWQTRLCVKPSIIVIVCAAWIDCRPELIWQKYSMSKLCTALPDLYMLPSFNEVIHSRRQHTPCIYTRKAQIIQHTALTFAGQETACAIFVRHTLTNTHHSHSQNRTPSRHSQIVHWIVSWRLASCRFHLEALYWALLWRWNRLRAQAWGTNVTHKVTENLCRFHPEAMCAAPFPENDIISMPRPWTNVTRKATEALCRIHTRAHF